MVTYLKIILTPSAVVVAGVCVCVFVFEGKVRPHFPSSIPKYVQDWCL